MIDQIWEPALSQDMSPSNTKDDGLPGLIENNCDEALSDNKGIIQINLQYWPGLTKDQLDTETSQDCDVSCSAVTFADEVIDALNADGSFEFDEHIACTMYSNWTEEQDNEDS